MDDQWPDEIRFQRITPDVPTYDGVVTKGVGYQRVLMPEDISNAAHDDERNGRLYYQIRPMTEAELVARAREQFAQARNANAEMMVDARADLAFVGGIRRRWYQRAWSAMMRLLR